MHQHASNRTRHGKRKAFEMKRSDWWVVTNGGGGRGARRLAARGCARAHVAAARRADNVCLSSPESVGVSVPSCSWCSAVIYHDAGRNGRQGVRRAARCSRGRRLRHGYRWVPPPATKHAHLPNLLKLNVFHLRLHWRTEIRNVYIYAISLHWMFNFPIFMSVSVEHAPN